MFSRLKWVGFLTAVDNFYLLGTRQFRLDYRNTHFIYYPSPYDGGGAFKTL